MQLLEFIITFSRRWCRGCFFNPQSRSRFFLNFSGAGAGFKKKLWSRSRFVIVTGAGAVPNLAGSESPFIAVLNHCMDQHDQHELLIKQYLFKML